MWLLFLLLLIVLVPLLIVVGAVAAVFVAAHAMPGLLILAGLWLLFTAGRGRRWRPAAAPPRHRPAPRPAPRQPATPQTSRTQPPARPRRELPIDVQIKVEQIRRKADMLLGYADRFPPFSQDLHIVRQTAAEYLPRTIDAYLALPGEDDPVVAGTGKTAQQELREQLGLLDSKLDEIAQDLQRQDLDRLLANRLFLEERFRLRVREEPADPPAQATDAA
jgi:hypothetical protein